MIDTGTSSLAGRLQERACAALAHWQSAGGTPQLLKYRENAVFRIALADGGPAVLRLHRPGYHDGAALASELEWMAMLRAGGLAVPAPLATPDGRLIVPLEPALGFGLHQADIVSWIDGAPIGESGRPLGHASARLHAIFHSLGAAMARLHALSDRWTPPSTFRRPAWDADGLLGEAPLWGRFWDCPGLRPGEAEALSALRRRLSDRLAELQGAALDYGLIHADLVRENVLVADDGVALIDFDDGGFGWRLFDIATALFKNRGEPDYAGIKDALIAGYRLERPLPEAALASLPLFMALRAVTYIGWIAARPETPDATARLERYVADALALGAALG